MDQVALGKRIKAARERAGMTQEDLAAAVDYSVDHMSVVERGVKAPKLDKLVTIANVLKVGTDELLQDNLDAATLLHDTELSERLKALSPEGQRKVIDVYKRQHPLCTAKVIPTECSIFLLDLGNAVLIEILGTYQFLTDIFTHLLPKSLSPTVRHGIQFRIGIVIILWNCPCPCRLYTSRCV